MTPKKVGDYGVFKAVSQSACPNCNADLGYYGDLIGGFTCGFCGATFEIESDPTFWYRCVGEGKQ